MLSSKYTRGVPSEYQTVQYTPKAAAWYLQTNMSLLGTGQS